MAFRFKGQSKFKNTAPKVAKREEWYNDVRAAASASDGNHVACSKELVAFPWESPTGQLCVLPLSAVGRVHAPSLVDAHSTSVTDFQFSPFQPRVLATGCETGQAAIFTLGDGEAVKGQVRLQAHDKRVVAVRWHPIADNILATAGAKSVKIWDATNGSSLWEYTEFKDVVQDCAWSQDGRFLITTSKDKIIRLFDPRAGSNPVREGPGHAGIKGSRVVWLTGNLFATTGFGQMREREVCVRDASDLSSPLKHERLDSNTGLLMPFFDEDTGLLYIAGKGDTTLRMFEVTTSKPFLSTPTTANTDSVQIGVGMIPKVAVDVMQCEVSRLLKLTKNALVPVSYRVPRKDTTEFASDLFPPTASDTAAQTGAEWWSGVDAMLERLNLHPAAMRKRAEAASEATAKAERKSGRASVANGGADTNGTNVDSTDVNAPEPGIIPSSTTALSGQAASVPVVTLKQKKALSVVRASPVRHIEGVPFKKFRTKEGVNKVLATNSGETDVFVGNEDFLVYPTQGPGGLLRIIQTGFEGRLPLEPPALTNTCPPIDWKFNPFDTHELAVGCDDTRIRVWRLPRGVSLTDQSEPALQLRGHQHKINIILYHPTAKGVLASASYDNTIKLWDIEQEKVVVSIDIPDLAFGMAFNEDGSQLAVTTRDTRLRVYDVPNGTLVHDGPSQVGLRGCRVVWLTKTRLATVGFNRQSMREVNIHDVGNGLSERIGMADIDGSSSIMVPHYDPDIKVLYLAGRGDTHMYTFEIVPDEPYIHKITPFNNNVQQLGIAWLPKHKVCDVKQVEVGQCFKLMQTSIQGIKWRIPRTKQEFFQDDLYPETLVTNEPTGNANDFFAGIVKPLKTMSLQPAGMVALSQAPKEAPKVAKYARFDENYKSPDQQKAELLDNMCANADSATQKPLEQDLMDGVDSDEWSD